MKPCKQDIPASRRSVFCSTALSIFCFCVSTSVCTEAAKWANISIRRSLDSASPDLMELHMGGGAAFCFQPQHGHVITRIPRLRLKAVLSVLQVCEQQSVIMKSVIWRNSSFVGCQRISRASCTLLLSIARIVFTVKTPAKRSSIPGIQRSKLHPATIICTYLFQ